MATLVTQEVKDAEQGWVYWESGMTRDQGQWDRRQRTGEEERCGLPGLGGVPRDRTGRYLRPHHFCLVQSRGLKVVCARESRWWHGDIPKAMDFLEAVTVIDLSHDRLKSTKRDSLKRKSNCFSR